MEPERREAVEFKRHWLISSYLVFYFGAIFYRKKNVASQTHSSVPPKIRSAKEELYLELFLGSAIPSSSIQSTAFPWDLLWAKAEASKERNFLTVAAIK